MTALETDIVHNGAKNRKAAINGHDTDAVRRPYKKSHLLIHDEYAETKAITLAGRLPTRPMMQYISSYSDSSLQKYK